MNKLREDLIELNVQYRFSPDGGDLILNGLSEDQAESLIALCEEGEGIDFRSPEAVRTLQQSDYIITNPPFSLFRDFFELLTRYGKKSLILGPINAVHYDAVFDSIMNGTVNLSPTVVNKFILPTGEEASAVAVWFTNIQQRPKKPLTLNVEYNPENYPKYENYDAIEVSKVTNIPKDHFGLMEVPVSYLLKHNPKQFKIMGRTGHKADTLFKTRQYTPQENKEAARIRGRKAYELKASGTVWRNGRLEVLFKRIFIQRCLK